MAHKGLIKIFIITFVVVTGYVDAAVNITNHGTKAVAVEFDYTMYNTTQTARFNIGPTGTIVWNSPAQIQICLIALRVNNIPAGLYTLQNVPKYQPSCMQSANIDIWPNGAVTVEGVTVRSGQMAPR